MENRARCCQGLQLQIKTTQGEYPVEYKLYRGLSSHTSEAIFELKGKHIYIYLRENECLTGLLKSFFKSKTHIHNIDQMSCPSSIVLFE